MKDGLKASLETFKKNDLESYIRTRRERRRININCILASICIVAWCIIVMTLGIILLIGLIVLGYYLIRVYGIHYALYTIGYVLLLFVLVMMASFKMIYDNVIKGRI